MTDGCFWNDRGPMEVTRDAAYEAYSQIVPISILFCHNTHGIPTLD